jgi:hypothetical protein
MMLSEWSNCPNTPICGGLPGNRCNFNRHVNTGLLGRRLTGMPDTPDMLRPRSSAHQHYYYRWHRQ